MKNKCSLAISTLTFMVLFLLVIFSCSKDDPTTKPPPPATVTDIDGYVYHTVTIGTQVWLIENLKTIRYRNGDLIPIHPYTDYAEWISLTTGAISDGATSSSSGVYGRLYNWYAVHDSRKLAPIGWHIPTEAEWKTLFNYVGGDSIAGCKLKEDGTTHWKSPNVGATNSTGFTALPGGGHLSNGPYYIEGSNGAYWSATEKSPGAIFMMFSFEYKMVNTYIDGKSSGFSVRCIMD